MFLLVPAYPGCPGSKAVKRSLLLLYVCMLVYGSIMSDILSDLHKKPHLYMSRCRQKVRCVCAECLFTLNMPGSGDDQLDIWHFA